MSLLGLDHIVVMVPDLGAAVRDYAELGFTVDPGGSHPGGTHNALIAFADGAYIELIAFERANPQHRWWRAAQNGGGLIDFCMRTDDLPADIAAFRRAGVEIEVSAGERLRPDGYRLRWTLAQPTAPHSFVVPFLIEDMTPREERVPRDHRHRNGVSGVAVLTVVVRDLALARGWWSLAEPQSVENVHRPELAAGGIGFAVGAQRFEFLAPNAGASPLSAWLAQRGAGPWSIALRTSREPVTLDERKARSRVMLAH